MNLPNKLTVSRFGLTIAFMLALFCDFPFNSTVALVLFILGGLTDWVDGEIARRRNLITNFGILMDPLADKIMTSTAFIVFVGLGAMPAWMVVLIVARELAITGLRLLAASKQLVLAAEGLGKHKTISQITTIIAILVVRSYQDWGMIGQFVFGIQIYGRSWAEWFTLASLWVTVLLTVWSGVFYLWRNRAVYLEDL